MTLPASGPISTAQINAELNYSSNRVISLNDAYVRQLAITPSGTVQISSLRGKTRYPQPFGNGAGPADYYFNTGGGTDSFWSWTSNFQAVEIRLNGTTLYGANFIPSTTTTITSGGRTYYRGPLQSGGGLFPAYYSFSWVE